MTISKQGWEMLDKLNERRMDVGFHRNMGNRKIVATAKDSATGDVLGTASANSKELALAALYGSMGEAKPASKKKTSKKKTSKKAEAEAEQDTSPDVTPVRLTTTPLDT